MSDTSETPVSTPPSGTATTESAGQEPDRTPRPRIRTGAVIWGLLLAVVAGSVLWTAVSSARRSAAIDAVLGLDGFGWTVVGVVVVGGVLTSIALAAVIRRIQMRLVDRTRESPRS